MVGDRTPTVGAPRESTSLLEEPLTELADPQLEEVSFHEILRQHGGLFEGITCFGASLEALQTVAARRRQIGIRAQLRFRTQYLECVEPRLGTVGETERHRAIQGDD